MRIDTAAIRRAEPAAEIRCAAQDFSYVDVADYSAKPTLPSAGTVLWCATSAATPRELTWYGELFRRVDEIRSIRASHPEWVVLTDSQDAARYLLKDYILVPDLALALERLHMSVVQNVGARVIGVTGSVGKTTCVGLVEDVFAKYAPTLRIYTKRIAPLNLFDIVINQLQATHKYIAMEYSMYHRWHVAELVRLMPPTVGVLLNIETSHLGIDDIVTDADILDAKRALLDNAEYAFAERSVALRFTEALPGVKTYDWRHYVTTTPLAIDPFVRSRLFYTQIGAALSAKSALIGEANAVDVGTINAFQPKEHRLTRLRGRKQEAFFDGEVTNAARLFALGDTLYTLRALVLHQVEFYEQHLEPQREQMLAALRLFDRVYISAGLNAAYRSYVHECASDCETVIFYEETAPLIPSEFTVVVHWGAYWRVHQDSAAAIECF